jgi:glycosyltransferase involved in cell wall biosynthesis
MISSQPRVSVLVRAYNVSPWIGECLDSILSQRTNFSIEILVHDDASTDCTPDILRSYSASYPNQLKVIFQSINQHSKGLNPASPLVSIATGEYLALCDGDDFWTDQEKLQKQVDFLDNNQEFSIVMHQSDLLEGDQRKKRDADGQTVYKLKDFVKQMAVGSASSSILCRNTVQLRADFSGQGRYDNTGADWLLCVSALKTGNLCFLHQSMSVYRIRPRSLYSTQRWIKQFQVHIHSALTVSAILDDRWKVQIININKRRLLLYWVKVLDSDEAKLVGSAFAELEDNIILRWLTSKLMNSPLSFLYGKYISKIFYWNLAISP